MIDKALDSIKNEVQRFIVSKINAGHTEEIVHLSPVVDDQGKLAIPNDSIGLSLLNIEEDRVNKSHNCTFVKQNDSVGYVNPPILLNLLILFAANFTDYKEALKILSLVVTCFQAKSHITYQENPELDPDIGKLILELQAPGIEQQNYLWGVIGYHYLPSVFYRVRLITIQDSQITSEGAAVTKLRIDGKDIMGAP